MAEEQGRQPGQAEEADGQAGELVEGEIQVSQVREGGERCGQAGEEARQRVTSSVIKTVSWNYSEKVELEAIRWRPDDVSASFCSV